MTVLCDWTSYDERARSTPATHRHLDDHTKAAYEEIARGTVGARGGQGWADVIGYGNDAVAVFKVPPPHRYENDCLDVVVKLSESNPRWCAQFHRDLMAGTEESRHIRDNRRLQRTIAITEALHDGRTLYVQILSYMPGLHLDASPSLNGYEVIAHLLKEILVPLWANGLRFFDFRASNLVYDKDAGIQLVDLDMLSKGYDEASSQAGTWPKRDTLEATALARLPGILHRILKLDSGKSPPSLTRARGAIVLSRLNEHLASLGRANDEVREAERAVDTFLAILKDNRA